MQKPDDASPAVRACEEVPPTQLSGKRLRLVDEELVERDECEPRVILVDVQLSQADIA